MSLGDSDEEPNCVSGPLTGTCSEGIYGHSPVPISSATHVRRDPARLGW